MPPVLNIPLAKMARAVAKQHGHEGAIIITKSSDGVYHVGLAGLTDREIQDGLCVGIHLNFTMMDARVVDEDGECPA